MRNIRTGTWETNSSSSHSITFVPNYVKHNIDLHGAEFIINGVDFGWGYEDYNDIYTKISYVAQETEDLRNYEMRLWLEEILKEELKCGTITYNLDGGYIDHNSMGTVKNTIETKEELRQFIFGQSTLIIDNDNH